MGHVRDGLYHLLEALEWKLIQDQGENDGCRESKEQILEVQEQGISQGIKEISVPEGPDVILKASVLCPRHDPNALIDQIFLKCDLHVCHGNVLKDQKIDQRQCQKSIELPIPLEIYAIIHLSFFNLYRPLHFLSHGMIPPLGTQKNQSFRPKTENAFIKKHNIFTKTSLCEKTFIYCIYHSFHLQ